MTSHDVSDKNVKAPNQVYQRFSALFPKINKKRDTLPGIRTGQFYLSGIAINSNAKANIEAVEANIEATIEAVSLVETNIEAIEAIKPTLAEIQKMIEQLSLEERQQLISFLTQTETKVVKNGSIASTDQPDSVIASTTASTNGSTNGSIASTDQPESVSAFSIASTDQPEPITVSSPNQLKVGSRVANIDPSKSSYNWHGTIINIGKYGEVHGAEVSWDERKGMKGGQVLFHRLEELRMI